MERHSSTARYPNGWIETMFDGHRNRSVEAIGEGVVLAKGDGSVWPPDLECFWHVSC